MRILVVGGESKIAKSLLPMLENHIVTVTTRKNYDLSKDNFIHLGYYHCVVLLACDYKPGRPDEEQKLCDDTNIDGIMRLLFDVDYERIIFISSYHVDKNTAYGKQKKAIEDFIKSRREKYFILRPEKIKDYDAISREIINGMELDENRCSYTSV